MHTVLLTGATGFIGQRVAQLILDSTGHRLVILHRRTSNLDFLDTYRDMGRITFVIGDIMDKQSLREALDSVTIDTVIHLACLSSWDVIGTDRIYTYSIEGTRNLLDALAVTQTAYGFIFLSSAAASGGNYRPDILADESFQNIKNAEGALIGAGIRDYKYGHAKRLTEKLLIEEREKDGPLKRLVLLRAGETYDRDDVNMVTATNVRGFMCYGVAPCVYGGITVCRRGEVAQGIVAAIEKGRDMELYNLGGENITIGQMASTIVKVSGRFAIPVRLPYSLLRLIIQVFETMHIRLFDLEALKYAAHFWYLDSAKAERELGYTYTSAADIFRDVSDWLDARAKAK